jgi:hypothetical protein
MNYKNAAPDLVLQGIDDRSTRALPVVQEQLPMHLPLLFVFSPTGPTEPQITYGALLDSTYGAAIKDYRSKFTTHATPFLNVFNEAANVMMTARLEPEDSTTATVRLWLDVLPTTIPLYERDVDGFYARDGAGALVPTGDTTPGHRFMWVATAIEGNIGEATTTPGSQTDGAVQSTRYPICDVPASFFGSAGDLTGLRFWAPTTRGLDPLDQDLAEEQGAYFYRMQIVKKPDAKSSPIVHRTINDAMYVQFALNPEAYDSKYRTDLFADRVIMKAYRNMDLGVTGVPTYGPVDQVYWYHENILALSTAVLANEAALSNLDSESPYLINILTGKTFNGAPYHSLIMQGPLDGGLEFSENATTYLTGGSDGTMNAATYEALVSTQLDNFGQLDVKYEDLARYPFSVFYDSGFDIETKLKIPRLMSIRKDISVCLATQSANSPFNTLDQDSSVGIALRGMVRSYPESTVHGTSALRANIVMQAGDLIVGDYFKPVPLTIELANKRARYMGAANGVMSSRTAYDKPENNKLTLVKNVRNTWKPVAVRNANWDNGLIWAQHYDRRQMFFPSIHTAYAEDTSILKSDINMLIAVELQKVCFRVWRDLVGRADLTNDQFIENSNRMINEFVVNRFDNRVVIVPDTFYTPADEQRGFSWNCRINMYGNNSKTVGAFTIVTYRLEDLVNA